LNLDETVRDIRGPCLPDIFGRSFVQPRGLQVHVERDADGDG
jgi:hypothetical protein